MHVCGFRSNDIKWVKMYSNEFKENVIYANQIQRARFY